MHWRRGLYLRNGQGFQVIHGCRTGGDDRRGDVDATGKKLTRTQVSSRSTPVSPATVANRNLCGPTRPPSGPDLGSKEIRAGVL